jgi:hypothetical protein
MARMRSGYEVDEPKLLRREQHGTAQPIRRHDDAGFHAELEENLDPGRGPKLELAPKRAIREPSRQHNLSERSRTRNMRRLPPVRKVVR